jgi:predicted phage terminase large subunit-like protein
MALKQASEKLLKRLRIIRARKNFLDYCHYVDPTFCAGRPQRIVGNEIQAWIDSPEPYILIIVEPPRHGKSQMCSRLLPGYLMGRYPDDKMLAASFVKDLAETLSRDAQRYMVSEAYAEVFPDTRLVTRGDRRGVGAIKRSDEFEIVGRKGRYKAAGVGGPFPGRGANWGVIDDPIKGRKESESATIRNSTKQWYHAEFRTRIQSGGKILIPATRWHNDDLSGHIIKTFEQNPKGDRVKIVWLPALSEGGKYRHPDDDREIGEALWPDGPPGCQWTREELIRIKESGNVQIGIYGGSYDWNALYQGRPEPPGGSKIKRQNLKIVKHVPDGLTWVRFWDLAVTEKTTADYTASGQMAIDSDNRIFVRRLVHFQREWPTVRRTMKMILAQERCPTGIEAVGTQTGFIQDLQQDEELVNAGLAHLIVAQSVDADKLTRALPWIARTEEGLFHILAGDGVAEYIDELVEFTGHDDPDDDQVDWTSGAFRMLNESFEAETLVFG